MSAPHPDRADLVDVRVIGTPEVAAQAVTRVAGLFILDRHSGPRPSRKRPDLVLYYLTGWPKPAAAGELGRAPLAEIEERKGARDLGGELAAIAGHCKVTLAVSLPLRLGSPWRSWTQYLGRDWCEPDEDRHAALASLVLRWPLPVASLPRPSRPARPGQPNLSDAEASVRVLVAAINATAGPVLATLEGGKDR